MMRIPLEEQVRIISAVKKRCTLASGHLLNLMISGSDLYGFASEDSDVDYRGTYILNTSKLLKIGRPRDVIEIMVEKQWNDLGIPISALYHSPEAVLFEVRKEIGLALKGNCNILEHLTAKPIFTTPEFLELRDMLLNSYGKTGLYNSYRGMAMFNYKKYVASGRRNTVKKYLYVFRGLLAGLYVLQTKEIQPNIMVLNQYFKIPEVKQLIKLKQENRENFPIPLDLDTGRIEEVILDLFNRMDEAFVSCNLPAGPSEERRMEVEDWLVEVRRRYLG